MPKSEKFPIRELRIPGVSGWEYNKSGNRRSTQKLVDSVRLTRLQPLVIEVLNEARGGSHAHSQLFPALPSDPRGDYRRCNGRGRTAVQLSNFASVIVEDQESGVMMPASGWMRRWKSETAPEERKGALILGAALESRELLRVEIGRDDTIPHLGPLVGMHDAIWVPLRAGARTLGLAMVGYASPQATLQFELESLRARAEEVALAVAHYSDARKRELAAEELRCLARLSRAILCGVSVDSILPQIARAARHHMQAEFVVLGRPGVSPMLAESWDGPEEWRAAVQQEPFLHMWRKVLEEGREVELGGEALPAPPESASDQAAPA